MIKDSTNLLHDDYDKVSGGYSVDYNSKIGPLDDIYLDYDSVLECSTTVENGIAQDDIILDRRRFSLQLSQEGTDIFNRPSKMNGSHLPIDTRRERTKEDSNTFTSTIAIKDKCSTKLIHDNDTRNDCEIGPSDEIDDVYLDYDSVLEYSTTVENGIVQDDIIVDRRRLSLPFHSLHDEASTSNQLTLMKGIILSVADELDLMSEGCWDALTTCSLSPSAAADIINLFKSKIRVLKLGEHEDHHPSTPPSMRPTTIKLDDGAGRCARRSIGSGAFDSDSSKLSDSAVDRWEVVNEWNPVPPFGLQSPEVSHLLHTWTADESKVRPESYTAMTCTALCLVSLTRT